MHIPTLAPRPSNLQLNRFNDDQLQLDLVYQTVSVNGYVDELGIEYYGVATLQPTGKWHCLANVGGALCVVEVRIKKSESGPGQAASAR